MLPALRLLFADTQAALGRLDYDSLNDQSRMEILIEGLDEDSKSYFQDENGAFYDVCEWIALSCDEVGNVNDLTFEDEEPLSGTLSLDFLPPKLIKVAIFNHEGITGTIDMTALPPLLKNCWLYCCAFTGSCVLTDLPRSLSELDVGGNLLSGTLDLTKLPESLTDINVSFNRFTGTLNLLHLPSGIHRVNFSNNGLSGRLDLSVVPAGLTAVWARNNSFSGLAIVASSYTGTLMIYETQIMGIIDESGAKHEREEREKNINGDELIKLRD